MKIIAVVVTYNRLPLLRKCIAALQEQSFNRFEILVINNSSTDGTAEWLTDQHLPFITLENRGGASGFNAGIRKAYESGAEWIWLMDDDTIAQPDALEQLLNAREYFRDCDDAIGFFSSLVQWTDGSPHAMNKTYSYHLPAPLPKCFSSKRYAPIAGATFVSLLLSRKAVERAGLPIKEFFIWSDDTEYTHRIVHSGMPGVFVPDSIVIHETPTNYCNNIFQDAPSNIWKYNYGMRNELYTRRMHKSEMSYWRNVAKRMFVWPFRILMKRKCDRWPFIKMIWRSSLSSIHFRPPVERIEAQPNK